MTQFDIFHVFVENSVNSELCFSYVFLNNAILGSVPSISSEVLGLLFNCFFVMPGYIKIFS